LINQIAAGVKEYKTKLSTEIDIGIATELEKLEQSRLTLKQLNPYD